MPYTFTEAQLVDIRRFCGYPARADGTVVFAAPFINPQFITLEYRLQHLTDPEGAVVVQYLTTLNALEQAITAAGDNLDTDQAAVWKHNRDEIPQRMALFDDWRGRLCAFLGVAPGPNFVGSSRGTVRMVV